MEKKGLKETLELLDCLKDVGVIVASISKDGKFNSSDLPELMKVIDLVGKAVEAIKGVSEVPAEIKDLDAAEIAQIGAKALEAFQAIKAA